MIAFPGKKALERLDYSLDWSRRLKGDAITSSSFVVESGDMIIDFQEFSDTMSTVWLVGGTTKTILVNTVTTSEGRTIIERIHIPLER